MPTIGPMIAASARLGLGYAERLLQDVNPEQFARFAQVGGTSFNRTIPPLSMVTSAFMPRGSWNNLVVMRLA